jgi:protein-tyrosine phosphatase
MKRIDFHSHILPGADHGSKNAEMSLQQIAMLQKAQVDAVVASPHFYPAQSSLRSFLDLRARSAELLQGAITSEHPKIYLGAEVLLCPEIEEMVGFEELCIAGTDVMLVELPYQRLSSQLFYAVENIVNTTSVRIVLAHIERYHPDDIADLMNLELLAQVNAEKLTERKNRKWLGPYFKAGRIVALGSDLHGAEKDGLKNYLKGLSKLGSKTEEKVYEYSAMLLKDAAALNG